MASSVITQAKTDRPPSKAPETSRTMATRLTSPVSAPRARARFLFSIASHGSPHLRARTASRAGSPDLGGPDLRPAVRTPYLGPAERRRPRSAAAPWPTRRWGRPDRGRRGCAAHRPAGVPGAADPAQRSAGPVQNRFTLMQNARSNERFGTTRSARGPAGARAGRRPGGPGYAFAERSIATAERSMPSRKPRSSRLADQLGRRSRTATDLQHTCVGVEDQAGRPPRPPGRAPSATAFAPPCSYKVGGCRRTAAGPGA